MCSDPLIKQVFKIAVPVAPQGMLQTSFPIVNRVMVGSLGSVSVFVLEIFIDKRVIFCYY